jgi:hypothetical protein
VVKQGSENFRTLSQQQKVIASLQSLLKIFTTIGEQTAIVRLSFKTSAAALLTLHKF